MRVDWKRAALTLVAIGALLAAAAALKPPPDAADAARPKAPVAGRAVAAASTPGKTPAKAPGNAANLPGRQPAIAPPVAPPVVAGSNKPTLEQLTAQAATLEKAMRGTSDPVERKRLLDELERIKHQMGPIDANGVRVRCQALWHDSAIESLDQEIKRLGAKPSTLTEIGPAGELRLATRRVARTCLAYGWAAPDTLPKYQVDAFGAYLVNNLRTLDAVFDSAAAGLSKEWKSTDLAEDAGAYQKASAKVRQGLGRMVSAADAIAKAPQDQPEALVAATGDFLGGLRAVRDAVDVMSDLSRRKGKAAVEAAAGEAAPAEPPPMTATEKKSVETIRRIMGRLKGDAWAPTVNGLERYVGAVENGFQLPIARPKARELLANLAVVASLAESLDASKAAYPEYVEMRERQLELVFQDMKDAESRPAGYARLDTIWKDDEFRRQMDAGGLAPASAQGLVRAYYDVVPKLLREAANGSAARGQALRDACRAVAGILDKAAAGPPADLTPALRDGFLRLQKGFRNTIEQAGAAFPADPAGGTAKLTAAANDVHGMDLLIRTDGVLKTITKYKAARVQAIYTQIARAAQEMAAKQGEEAAAARQTVQMLIQPFEELSRFPMPEPDLSRSAVALVGRAYGPAVAALNQAIGAGLDAAAGGDPLPLKQALGAQYMFGLLRHRAQAATYRLDKTPTANLVTFSVPDSVWGKFVPALDKKMQEAFAQYGSQGATRAPYVAATADWDYVYADVLAGVRLTADGRLEGESDLDLLMRNLDRTTLVSPDRPTAQVWAAGYHATEAAASLTAGFDLAATYHRNLMRSYDTSLRAVDLVPSKREGHR